jgi:hypothetical protein
VFGVNVCCDSTGFLCFGNYVQGKRGLAGTFRAVDLHDPPAGHTANAYGGIQTE